MGTCEALRTRMERWRAFHSRKTPGDLLFYVWGERGVSLEGFLCQQFKDNPPERVLDEARIPGLIEQYVAQLRQAVDAGYRLDDDATATALVYWGIGALNAAMTGGEPFHDGVTSLFDPNLDWERIDELAFDPDNKWVRFAVAVNR
ncbi:MAG: hypothetical protein NTV86_21535, partial [Planctomycetota bacterium]|nr:hypothetical protein [Planctomycetota bacterium]